MSAVTCILSLSSTGKRTGGAGKELFTGKCSCRAWSHPQSTREVIREAHGEHVQNVAVRNAG